MKKLDDENTRGSGLFIGSDPLESIDRRSAAGGDDDGHDGAMGDQDGTDADRQDTDGTDKGDLGDKQDSDGKD